MPFEWIWTIQTKYETLREGSDSKFLFFSHIHASYVRWAIPLIATLCLYLFPLTIFSGASFACSGWTKQGATVPVVGHGHA